MTNIILTSPEELQAIISQTMKEELRTINSQPPEKEPELITRQETSKILGVSLPTLHNWIFR